MRNSRKAVVAVLALACAALSACNMVVTKQPLFSKADASALELREGLWDGAHGDCKVDEAQPVDAWPECADPQLIRGGALRAWDRSAKAWKDADMSDLLIVSGDPLVLQVRFKSGENEIVYLYAGLQPRLDGQNRIVAMAAWPVLCGPPPEDKSPDGKGGVTTTKGSGATKHPFPGMTMDDKDQNCITADKHALHEAARASKAFQEVDPLNHWVRDADR